MSIGPLLVDTDFHLLADDHEALRMLAMLHRKGGLQIDCITTVTGNAWAQTCTEHAKTALGTLNLAHIPVFEGATQPLVHRQSDFAHRSRLYGAAFGGAWGSADLLEKIPKTQPKNTSGQETHAVEHIVARLRESAVPITILAIGPLTNLAMAIRLAPDIVGNIQEIVAMGGAFYAPGNVTPSAEFNWWFDAEAAAIVLEEKIKFRIIPLDATDKVNLDFDRYSQWQSKYGDHSFFRSFHEPKFASLFATDPAFKLPMWDAMAAGCLISDSLISTQRELWLTVDCSSGPSYGRVIAFDNAAEFNLNQPNRPKAQVVLEVNATRFWDLYESLIFEA